MNVAVAERSWLMLTVHDVPVQSPDQPENIEPLAAVAIKTTDVPDENVAEQAEPQLMPEGELVNVPEPVPLLKTNKV